ncbi:MAG: stage III sporulation protein AC [Clostridia bacterium]|nr:stage III sporulation protein AC [Clostridia bacterium]
MELDLIFKIAGTGIIVAILHRLLVQAGREEQALMLSIGGLVVVMLMIVSEINALFEAVRTMFTY